MGYIFASLFLIIPNKQHEIYFTPNVKLNIFSIWSMHKKQQVLAKTTTIMKLH